MARTTTSATTQIIRDYGGTVLVAAAAALMIRVFVIEAYRIPTYAMKPALEAGDTIFVLKWRYREPKRGDVVVFSASFPGSEGKRDFIKRVVALPGETVSLRKGWIQLNGKELRSGAPTNSPCEEERLPEGKAYSVCREMPWLEDFGPVTVPAGSVFVVGDLRSRNLNSPPIDRTQPRGWGVIPAAAIKGKAIWVWLSIEPRAVDGSSALFPQFRFERMFRRIE